MRDLDFCQNPKAMLEYGVISRRGPRNNRTDCETDIIMIHVPTGKGKRFHGSFYEENYKKNICEWIRSFPRSKEGVTISKLNHYYTCSVIELPEKAE